MFWHLPRLPQESGQVSSRTRAMLSPADCGQNFFQQGAIKRTQARCKDPFECLCEEHRNAPPQACQLVTMFLRYFLDEPLALEQVLLDSRGFIVTAPTLLPGKTDRMEEIRRRQPGRSESTSLRIDFYTVELATRYLSIRFQHNSVLPRAIVEFHVVNIGAGRPYSPERDGLQRASRL